MVLFPHLWGKITESSSSTFWQNPLLSKNSIVFQSCPQQNSPTVNCNTDLLALTSPWPLSPAGKNIQDWVEKFLYQNSPTRNEIISCFSSDHLGSLKDQMKTWHHNPCLKSSPYQEGVISGTSSVSKGAHHIKATWKPQLWGGRTFLSHPSQREQSYLTKKSFQKGLKKENNHLQKRKHGKIEMPKCKRVV